MYFNRLQSLIHWLPYKNMHIEIKHMFFSILKSGPSVCPPPQHVRVDINELWAGTGSSGTMTLTIKRDQL